jgi:hypothetical protein
MIKSSESIHLDELAAGKLPERVVAAIQDVELTVEEVLEWEASQPSLRVSTTNGKVRLRVRVEISYPKLITLIVTVLSGLSGMVWTGVHFLSQHPAVLQALVDALLHPG